MLELCCFPGNERCGLDFKISTRCDDCYQESSILKTYFECVYSDESGHAFRRNPGGSAHNPKAPGSNPGFASKSSRWVRRYLRFSKGFLCMKVPKILAAYRYESTGVNEGR